MLNVYLKPDLTKAERANELVRAAKEGKFGPKVSVGAWPNGQENIGGVLFDAWIIDEVREASSAVEHQTDNLGVSGSIPGLRTT